MEKHLDEPTLAGLAAGRATTPAHAQGCEPCAEALQRYRQLIDALDALPAAPQELVAGAKALFRRQQRLNALVLRLAQEPALQAEALERPEAVLSRAGLEPVPELIALIREPQRGRRSEPEQRLAARRLWG